MPFIVEIAPAKDTSMQISKAAQTVSTSDGAIMLTIAGRPLFQLNTLAATIWAKLVAGLSVPQIITQLATQFDVPEERVTRDVTGFVDRLRQHLLVNDDPIGLDSIAAHAELVWNKAIPTVGNQRIPNEFPSNQHYTNASELVGSTANSPEQDTTLKPMVRTFDLFDTLIARRCVEPKKIFEQMERQLNQPGFATQRIQAERELAGTQYTLEDIYRRLSMPNEMALELKLESDNIFPIIEMVSKVGVSDLIVSDMYLPKNFLRSIVDRTTGLVLNPIVVTTDGKSSGKTWEKLKETIRIVEHTGDNPHSDLLTPRQQGIPSTLTKVASFSVEERVLYEDGFVGLAKTMREARLTTFDPGSLTRRLQLLQIQLNFPLLFLGGLALHRKLTADNVRNVLMSSRDCFLWHYLQERIRDMSGGSYQVVYFLTSRLARAFPSSAYLQYLNQFLAEPSCIVDLGGTGWSLKRLIERSANPRTPIFLLTHYEAPRLEREYESVGETRQTAIMYLLTETHDSVERANFARHPMVKDMINQTGTFLPVFFNPVDICWQDIPQIRIQHEAFFHTMKVMERNDLSTDLLVKDEITLERLGWLYKRIIILDEWLNQWFGDFQRQEERATRAALEQMANRPLEENIPRMEEAASAPQRVYDLYRRQPNQDMWHYSPFLRKNAKGNILEIGVRDGVSTAAFLLGIEQNGGHLFSVDINPNCRSLYGHPQWTFIHADSKDVDKVYPYVRSVGLDILFIDGDHSREGIQADLRNYAPLVKKGGILLVHDITPIPGITPQMVAAGGADDAVREEYEKFAAETGWTRLDLTGRYGMGVLIRSAEAEHALVRRTEA